MKLSIPTQVIIGLAAAAIATGCASNSSTPASQPMAAQPPSQPAASNPQPATGGSQSSITHEPFGTTQDGQAVEVYTLQNDNGMVVRILTYGGIVQTIKVPDKNGQMGDVVLGYDTL
ncbi:MAG TPA: hypothetical protein VGY98_09800, partial [Verrucomicrobiae bacterium]|nr:hypothetical protein [Verrucomicrobiae bacterium]